MSVACVRPLGNYEHIGPFLEFFSDLKPKSNEFNIIQKRMGNIERQLVGIENLQTLTHQSHRCSSAQSDEERQLLRIRVIDELIGMRRPDKEIEMSLGFGGALPKTAIQKNAVAIIVIGLPGSGKSTVSEYVSDKYGAVLLDADMAKRKLPEFNDNDIGADLTHEESKSIIFGDQDPEKDSFCIGVLSKTTTLSSKKSVMIVRHSMN